MSIYISDAHKLMRAWGDRPCDHPTIESEREDLGGGTGDYRCGQCGRIVSDSLYDERQNQSQPPRQCPPIGMPPDGPKP